jgi:hypothetical protein
VVLRSFAHPVHYTQCGLHNTVQSCSRHGVVADRFNSERPGSVIHFSKTLTPLSKVKVNFSLERALKAQKGNRGIALLFL